MVEWVHAIGASVAQWGHGRVHQKLGTRWLSRTTRASSATIEGQPCRGVRKRSGWGSVDQRQWVGCFDQRIQWDALGDCCARNAALVQESLGKCDPKLHVRREEKVWPAARGRGSEPQMHRLHLTAARTGDRCREQSTLGGTRSWISEYGRFICCKRRGFRPLPANVVVIWPLIA